MAYLPRLSVFLSRNVVNKYQRLLNSAEMDDQGKQLLLGLCEASEVKPEKEFCA